MGWIAGKRQRVKRDGEYVWVEPGDPIPEAEYWPNRKSWERQGFIRHVARGTEPVSSKKSPTMTATRAAQTPTSPEARESISRGQESEGVSKAPVPPEEATEAKGETTEHLSGPGACPWCGKDFMRLERHICKKRPEEG